MTENSLPCQTSWTWFVIFLLTIPLTDAEFCDKYVRTIKLKGTLRVHCWAKSIKQITLCPLSTDDVPSQMLEGMLALKGTWCVPTPHQVPRGSHPPVQSGEQESTALLPLCLSYFSP